MNKRGRPDESAAKSKHGKNVAQSKEKRKSRKSESESSSEESSSSSSSEEEGQSRFVERKPARPRLRLRIKEVTEGKEGHGSNSEQTNQGANKLFKQQVIKIWNRQLDNENWQLRHDKTRTSNEIQQLRQQKRQLENDNRQLREENGQLENDNQQLREEKSQSKNDNQQLRQEKSQLQNKNQQLRQEWSQSKNENQRLRQEKSRMQNDNQQLRQEKSQLQDDNQQLLQEKSRLWNDNQQLRQEKGRLKNENQHLRQEKSQLQNEYQHLQQQRSQFQNENQQLREDKNQSENENQQLRQENDDMSNEVQDLRQRNNNMEIEIQQLHEFTMCSFITESGTVTVSNEILGKGGWSAVYTGDFYGTKVAVKEFYEIILSPHNMEILKREINIASQCRHPNLLQFICATKNSKNQLLIVTELMDMALRTFLEQQAGEKLQLKHAEVKLISLDVARGLNYLHSKTPNPIIHRDISSANVLLWIENGSVRRAKVSDYGSANFMQACNTAYPGAALYAAPEAMRAQHDPKIDVFSYGLLVCEMTNCKLPHSEPIRRKREIMRIANAEVKELVEECTRMHPRERPTMQDVIERWQEI